MIQTLRGVESRYINGVGGTGEGLYRQLSREESCNGRLDEDTWQEPYDLADLTLQCGRRGDSLKLFMGMAVLRYRRISRED